MCFKILDALISVQFFDAIGIFAKFKWIFVKFQIHSALCLASLMPMFSDSSVFETFPASVEVKN